jgi:hypothetical protein
MRDPIKYAEEKRKKKAGMKFSQPPFLGLVTRLFRGVKYDIKNIHIRYEDDFFSMDKPFSFGFTIQNIKLDTHTDEEQR